MARKGRDLELLIEKLEKSVLPEDAIITSPGFISDRITKQKREVDILIEYEIGTTPIKIIIECRKRTSVQDTQWIEQIQTKVNDLKANKVIAVSSSSFTKPAKEKANFYNIETRTYTEIDSSIINSWWKVNFLDLITKQYALKSVNLVTDNPNLSSQIIKNKKFNDKIIYKIVDNKKVSANNIFEGLIDKIPDYLTMKPNDKPVTKNINVTYSNEKDRFILKKDEDLLHITSIQFIAELSIKYSKIPISRVSSYQNDSKTISEVIEFDGVKIGENNTLQFIKNPDGSISLSSSKN